MWLRCTHVCHARAGRCVCVCASVSERIASKVFHPNVLVHARSLQFPPSFRNEKPTADCWQRTNPSDSLRGFVDTNICFAFKIRRNQFLPIRRKAVRDNNKYTNEINVIRLNIWTWKSLLRASKINLVNNCFLAQWIFSSSFGCQLDSVLYAHFYSFLTL